MIQAPSLPYIPAQQFSQPAYMPQGTTNAVQGNYQTPGVIYNYPTASSYLPQQYSVAQRPQYNGVNIEINNPQGQGMIPGYMPANFVPVQQPYIPMAPAVAPTPAVPAQPYMPIDPNGQVPAAPAQPYVPAAPIPAVPAQPYMPIDPNGQVPAQPYIPTNDTQVPATQTPTVEPSTPAPVIVEPETTDPNMTPASFAAKLSSSDLDQQRAAIEEIAEAVKYNDQLAPSLLDTQIFDALMSIIDKDTSGLEGPSPDVIELRQKDEQQLTAEELTKAKTPAPLEKAEINKQYALYTISYLQERLNNELEKRGGQALALKDLPGIDKLVDTVKGNPNPMLRVCAIAALSHIAKPMYKEDLNTIFELAKSDEDVNVQEAAKKAISLLS